jgi:hypothetical protein
MIVLNAWGHQYSVVFLVSWINPFSGKGNYINRNYECQVNSSYLYLPFWFICATVIFDFICATCHFW